MNHALGVDTVMTCAAADDLSRQLMTAVLSHKAEADRLRAELAELRVNSNAWRNDALLAEAAIARVREVCMQDSWDIKLAGVGFVDVRLVLRALDGVE